MKIAVTGATGFIGRHVLAELARHKVEVIAVVRSMVIGDRDLACAGVVHYDIQSDQADAYELMGRPDALIHLAWSGLPNYHSLHHFDVELPAHFRFLKSLIAAGLETLHVTGTCFEYGMQSGPLSEDMETKPSNPYGFAKDTLRRQLEYLNTTLRFNLVWSRLFYLYGEGQADNSLYSQLRSAVKRGETAFNMSGGEQLRDYLPVSDVARAIVALTLRRVNIGVVNICAGYPVSVRRLVENWIRENHWTIKTNLGQYPYPDYEPMAFWGSAQKLHSLIGIPT